YNQHFSIFIRLALIVYTPFLAGFVGLTASLTMSLGWGKSYSLFLFVLSSIFLLLGITWANAVNGGVSVPVVARLLMSSPRPVQLSTIFAAFRKRLHAYLFITILTQRSTIVGLIYICFFCLSSFTRFQLASPT